MSDSNTKKAEPTARREAKNTVFIDLFHIPKYRFDLFRSFHPERTDVKESDIETVTLHPVILNLPYNDLALLVQGRLMIFVEAQSTWSINILIRLLLYLALTYNDYLKEKGFYMYGPKKCEFPEPEFYVVFTGKDKVEKDTISLRNDFFENPNAKIDLEAKVIYTENKDDIVGQYIIFSHVFDEQVKKYGRTRKAVEETIRICKDDNVLKEYLESREKEVIDIMVALFDQEYATEAYGNDRERTGEIKGLVETYQELGQTLETAVFRVAAKFGLDTDESKEYVDEFWKK